MNLRSIGRRTLNFNFDKASLKLTAYIIKVYTSYFILPTSYFPLPTLISRHMSSVQRAFLIDFFCVESFYQDPQLVVVVVVVVVVIVVGKAF